MHVVMNMGNNMIQKILTECKQCNGTGLYIGCCEREGTAIVCASCEGTGCAELIFLPFVRRKGRRGIKTVHRSLNESGYAVTYLDFKNGKMP